MMASLMSRGMSMVRRVLADTDNGAGIAVVYSREGASVGLDCWASQPNSATSQPGQRSGDAVRVEYGERHYLIPASALILSGSATSPKRYDRITETASGIVCEVMAGDGEPAWQWSDSERTLYRVRAKSVG